MTTNDRTYVLRNNKNDTGGDQIVSTITADVVYHGNESGLAIATQRRISPDFRCMYDISAARTGAITPTAQLPESSGQCWANYPGIQFSSAQLITACSSENPCSERSWSNAAREKDLDVLQHKIDSEDRNVCKPKGKGKMRIAGDSFRQ